jgi:replicative superfamily II helicase
MCLIILAKHCFKIKNEKVFFVVPTEILAYQVTEIFDNLDVAPIENYRHPAISVVTYEEFNKIDVTLLKDSHILVDELHAYNEVCSL